MIIRVLLLFGLAAIAYLAFLRRNRLPIHILLIFGMLSLGAFFTLFPDYANVSARFVGVGRGADLISYVLDLVFLFTLLFYYTKFVEIERAMTAMVRELAILRAQEGPAALQSSGRPPTSDSPAGRG